MKTADGNAICAKFNRGKCEKPTYGGGCARRGGTLMHKCNCIVEMTPNLKLCCEDHQYLECNKKAAGN